jgi:hypothetical protein
MEIGMRLGPGGSTSFVEMEPDSRDDAEGARQYLRRAQGKAVDPDVLVGGSGRQSDHDGYQTYSDEQRAPSNHLLVVWVHRTVLPSPKAAPINLHSSYGRGIPAPNRTSPKLADRVDQGAVDRQFQTWVPVLARSLLIPES